MHIALRDGFPSRSPADFSRNPLFPSAPGGSQHVAVVAKTNGIPFWGVNSPPILEPVLVVGLGALGVRDFGF